MKSGVVKEEASQIAHIGTMSGASDISFMAKHSISLDHCIQLLSTTKSRYMVWMIREACEIEVHHNMNRGGGISFA